MRSAGCLHSARGTPSVSTNPSESTTYGRTTEGTRFGLDPRPISPRSNSTKLPTSFENRSSLRREKPLNQLGAFLGLHAALHIHAVIQPRMPHDIPHRPAHPRFLV